MKLLIAAAVALLATPALAQDQSMQADPAAGYQPASPMPAVPAGATVTFQQAPSPGEAYPAPAAMDHYPWCKPGQFDNCRENENAKGQGVRGGHSHWHHRWHHHKM
jgi:hypothetical protein